MKTGKGGFVLKQTQLSDRKLRPVGNRINEATYVSHVGIVETLDELNDCALARPTGPNNCHRLTRFNLQVEFAQNLKTSVRKEHISTYSNIFPHWISEGDAIKFNMSPQLLNLLSTSGFVDRWNLKIIHANYNGPLPYRLLGKFQLLKPLQY